MIALCGGVAHFHFLGGAGGKEGNSFTLSVVVSRINHSGVGVGGSLVNLSQTRMCPSSAQVTSL